jgi:hypothetical protein
MYSTSNYGAFSYNYTISYLGSYLQGLPCQLTYNYGNA